MSTVTRRRACEGKRKLTREEAHRDVARLVKGGAAAGSVTAYRCPFDRTHWHTGHVVGRRKRAGGRP